MKINFLNALNPKSKMNEFQDLDHIDGVSITTVCANLYNTDIRRAAVEYSFFSYAIYNTCLHLLEDNKSHLCSTTDKTVVHDEICSQLIAHMEDKMVYVTGKPAVEISHLRSRSSWKLVTNLPNARNRCVYAHPGGLVTLVGVAKPAGMLWSLLLHLTCQFVLHT